MSHHRTINISIEEYTTPAPLTVNPEAELEELRDIMKKRKIRHLPVVEENKPIGIISERDVHVLFEHAIEKKLTARDVMTPGPFTLAPNTPLHEAALKLSEYKIGSALIVDDKDELVGIFTATDALNALVEVVRGDYET